MLHSEYEIEKLSKQFSADRIREAENDRLVAQLKQGKAESGPTGERREAGRRVAIRGLGSRMIGLLLR